MSDQELRRMFEARSQKGRVRACSDEEVLASFVDGTLSGRARDQLQRHLADCPACLEQVSVLTKLAEEAPAEVAPTLLAQASRLAPQHRPVQGFTRWRWAMAAAAMLVVAVSIAPLMRRSQLIETQPPPVAPAPNPNPAQRSVRRLPGDSLRPDLLFPTEGAAVVPSDLEFRWTPVGTALYYEVRILSAEGEVVWETRSEGTDARPPGTLHLVPGMRYYVSVSAWLSQGKAAKSPVTGFTVSQGQ
jgi:hypothetical protein